MIVKVDFDPADVWRLSDVAEAAGLSLGEWVWLRVLSEDVPVVGRRVHSTSVISGEATLARVVELHAEGLSDAEIALGVGRVVEHVARLRRSQRLKPNRKLVERSA